MDHKLIPLRGGQVAIVDTADHEWLTQIEWRAYWDPTTRSHYAVSAQAGRHVSMHREILGLKSGDPRTGDHIVPGQTLDNRRSNLRIATRAQQQHNTRRRCDNSTGFKGVSPKKGRYIAQITIQGKRTHLGYFDAAHLAAMAYDLAAVREYGEFAYTNFSRERVG